MPTPRPALEPVLDAYRALDLALKSLTATLADAPFARVFAVDPVRDRAVSSEAAAMPVQGCIESESDESLDPIWARAIPVRVLEGEPARKAALKALKKTTRPVDQIPTRPDRTPGVVWAPHARVTSAVRAANAAKTAFEKAVQTFSRPLRHHKERAEAFFGTELEHVFLIEAYRRIVLLSDPVEAIGFCWSGASRSVERMTVREASEWVASLNQFSQVSEWTQRVASIEGTHVAWVKRLAPFPIANVKRNGHWAGNDDAPKMRANRVMAHTPIIVTCKELPEIRDLQDYVPDKRSPGGRQDRLLKDEPLIEDLPLYEYRVAQ